MSTASSQSIRNRDNAARANGDHTFRARGLRKRYADTEVLSDFDLEVRRGEIVALLGENGAGKSTVSLIIAGAIRPDAGRMQWRGRPYAPATPRDALAAGVGLIHQEIRLLPDLSIAENVFVGKLPSKNGAIDRNTMHRRAGEQLRRLGLDAPPTTMVRDLQVAAQQQVEIAKALCLQSQLLILDEPTAALGADETERLFSQLRRLREDGVSFIYISHRLDEISRIADRIIVLRDGKLVAAHDDAQTPIDTLVREMVGRNVDRIFPPRHAPRDHEALSVENLSAADGAFADVSFSVRGGEIFGIAGIVGAGRTELMRAITGADPVAGGAIKVNGEPTRITTPRDAIRAGVVLVPEDRKLQGLILEHTVAGNIAAGNFDIFARNGWAWWRKIRDFARAAIARTGVKGAPEQRAGALSGGNQQKAVIAKWVARAPRVFILDEPTRGIDVGARAAIYELIVGLARAGAAIVLVSSDLDEVLGLSHRTMVLSRGRQRAILEAQAAEHETVINLATT